MTADEACDSRGVLLPLDKRGKPVRCRKNPALAVILTVLAGFLGVLYTDIRWGLYLSGGFALSVLLMVCGTVFGVPFLVFAAYLIYVLYRLVCLCVAASVCCYNNEQWAFYEERVEYTIELKRSREIDELHETRMVDWLRTRIPELREEHLARIEAGGETGEFYAFHEAIDEWIEKMKAEKAEREPKP